MRGIREGARMGSTHSATVLIPPAPEARAQYEGGGGGSGQQLN